VTVYPWEAEECVACQLSAAVVAEAEQSPADQGCTARFVLDLGPATPESAAVAHQLARRMLGQVQVLLADPATALSAPLRTTLSALADALAERTAERATVMTLDTPLARAWRAHPAGSAR
jgi:hypothetical protein